MDTMIVGTGSSNFGMFVDKPLRQLAALAVSQALNDAGIVESEVGLVVVGNAAGGVVMGQEMIRAQTIMSESLLVGRPMMAVENACASSSSAQAPAGILAPIEGDLALIGRTAGRRGG